MKVLIADDNPNSRQLVKDILESVGYTPLVAIDGPSALAAAQSQVPDLIILDVNMPGMSGFDVCAALKADQRLNHIPIMMLTAQADVNSRVTGLGLGADDYLPKPFNPRELAARVDARLRSKIEADDLRKTKEMIRQTFERFVAPSVVEKLLSDPAQVKLGGHLQEVTVMFSDLEGFTGMSERTEPEKLLSLLNDYHELVVGFIQAHAGTVNKFIGDGVMALYNTPLVQPDHAVRAVSTALQIKEKLVEFSQQFAPEHRMLLNFGINTGTAVVGNVGTQDIMDFTAVGDTVNLAARLQSRADKGQIIISQSTYDRLYGKIAVTPIGLENVKGRSEPVMLYEAVGFKS